MRSYERLDGRGWFGEGRGKDRQRLKIAPSRAGVEDAPGTWRTKCGCWGTDEMEVCWLGSSQELPTCFLSSLWPTCSSAHLSFPACLCSTSAFLSFMGMSQLTSGWDKLFLLTRPLCASGASAFLSFMGTSQLTSG